MQYRWDGKRKNFKGAQLVTEKRLRAESFFLFFYRCEAFVEALENDVESGGDE